MKYLILFGALFLYIEAHAQGTQACFLDESQQPANGARVEVFEDNVLIGSQDLGLSNCTNLGIIIATESQEVPSRDFSLETYPTVGNSRFTSQLGVTEALTGRLSVYSIEGRRVISTERRIFPPGQYGFELELGNVASGSYFVVFESKRGPITSQVFVIHGSAGGNAIREIGSSQSSIQEERIAARKMGGFEYKLRITRCGSRQTIVSLNRGENKTIVLENARRLFIDARLATNHSVHLIDSNPGILRVEDIRSGLTHEIAYEGEATAIQLLSDSLRVNYVAAGINSGMQAIRDNPDGTPRRTMTASFHEEIPGPLFLPQHEYEMEESHAFLFAIPETFDHEMYFDERLNTFFIRWDPVERTDHSTFDFTDDAYRQPGKIDPNRITRYYTFSDRDPKFSPEDEDIVRDLMANKVPLLFANTIYEVEFIEIEPPERDNPYVIELLKSPYNSDGSYYLWNQGWENAGVLIDLSIWMPIVVQWTPSMFLHTVANAMWAGKDLNDPIDKVVPGTTDYTESAREIMAVVYAYGTIRRAYDPLTGEWSYHVDPLTGNISGVFLSHFWGQGKRSSVGPSPVSGSVRFGAGAGRSR